jgi:2-polyprenyl-3-methyl-5-hydroxy-6-metoxy-1,4-benzoquinol methylase
MIYGVAVAGGEQHEDRTAMNRALWDERVPAHAHGAFYNLDGVVQGRDDLRPWEDSELGSIHGLDVVHLQCHIGTDTVALARRGAHTVGLDFSAPALDVASSLFDRCGLMGEWVCADVYDAVKAVGRRKFDVVYTGMGALCWLPDLRAWARMIAELLRPGGRLYMTELHPLWMALIRDGRTISQDAIDAEVRLWDDHHGSYAAPDVEFRHNASWERLHAVSDVLSALLDAGLHIDLFHEFDATPCPTPWLRLEDDGLYHFPPGSLRFPLSFSLGARCVQDG